MVAYLLAGMLGGRLAGVGYGCRSVPKGAADTKSTVAAAMLYLATGTKLVCLVQSHQYRACIGPLMPLNNCTVITMQANGS